jgi:hypothetical protein
MLPCVPLSVNEMIKAVGEHAWPMYDDLPPMLGPDITMARRPSPRRSTSFGTAPCGRSESSSGLRPALMEIIAAAGSSGEPLSSISGRQQLPSAATATNDCRQSSAATACAAALNNLQWGENACSSCCQALFPSACATKNVGNRLS